MDNTRQQISTRSRTAQTRKTRLHRAMRLALAGGTLALTATTVLAELRDHGPADSVLAFPQWYRDINDLAIGICKYDDDAGNGPLCLLAGVDPAGFRGNIGEEAFYSNLGVIVPVSGGSFDYVAALEMAYMAGPPPAIRDPSHPDEVVFSRIRMRMDIPPGCAGHYTIRHPFGIKEFDAEEGGRAINFTDDVTPIQGDFAAALKGHQGPFLTWDTDLPITVTPPTGAPREYIGDPNILHTYTGSIIGNNSGRHPEYEYQNFIEIEGPQGCDLGGSDAPNIVFEPLGALSGLKWNLPIATPTRIDRAVYARDRLAGHTVMDIWAESAPAQNLVLTASDNSTQSVPSVKMTELSVPKGMYYAHLELSNVAPPPAVTVVNLSSNPVARDSRAVVDSVIVTKADYNPVSKRLCVAAHSGDDSDDTPDPLSLVAPAYGSFGAPTVDCPRVASNDVVLDVQLDDPSRFPGQTLAPPAEVLVRSALGGSTSASVVIQSGRSDATVHSMAVDDRFDNVQGSGTTALNLVESAPDVRDTTPTNYRLVIVSQPTTGGTVTAPATGGTATFVAEEGTPTVDTHFYYALLDTDTNVVSNVARVDLRVNEQAAPPVGVADTLAVLRTNSQTGSISDVLLNDVPGPGGFAIDPNTLQILSQPTYGNAQVSGGKVIVKARSSAPLPPTTRTVDAFTYQVANSKGAVSAPVTVTVVWQPQAEALNTSRVRFSSPRWDIRFSTSWFGAPLAPVGTCWLTTNSAGQSITPQLIGSAAADATGAFQIQATTGGGVPSVTGNSWRVTCRTSNGGSLTSGSR